jgi:ATP-grasp domain
MRTGRPDDSSESSFPKVLLAAGNWWPIAARAAISLRRYGARVAAICPPGHPLHDVSGLEEIHSYRRFAARRSLLAAIRQAQPDVIIPCDDRSVALLHQIYRQYPEHRALIERSLGRAASFAVVASRTRLLEVANSLGVLVPSTCRLVSTEDASRRFGEYAPTAIIKLDGSYGGEGVRVVRSAVEAATAFRRMLKGQRLGTALKRALVNQDPLAMWAFGRRELPAISLQRFVNGTPANIMCASWQGTVLGTVSVEALSCQGETGAANVVRVIHNDAMRTAASLLAHQLHLSGFFGLDFILERSSGHAFLIEMNPRCTQLGHLPLESDGDLIGALWARVTGVKRTESDFVIEQPTIAFFPQSWQWDTSVDLMRSAYHDVPWGENALIEGLLRAPWPERQWPARAYHRFYRAPEVRAVEFDSAVPAASALNARRDGDPSRARPRKTNLAR